MSAEKAQTMIDALQQAAAYDHPVEKIALFETHISWVLLTGAFVYKIKKPVDFGFLDFSTLEKRRFYCEEELRLNRRLAPDLYLEVVSINGSHESPHINTDDTVIEYAVKMRQFDPEQTFDELLKRDALKLAHMAETATVLAAFHQQINVAGTDDPFGTTQAIEQPVQENFSQLTQALAGQQANTILDSCETLQRWSGAQHKELSDIFEQRKQAGFIRECHGDLHLRNIVLWQHKVTPFDGIEFNANLRWVDVMSELAFLLMDLDDHQQAALARHLLNRYLAITGDYAGLRVLRFYQVYRAVVRAKVASLRLSQLTEPKPDCIDEIRNYIQLALTYTQPNKPRLIITHGLSGSGKSYLSQQLVQSADLIHLRSDVERKRLFGLTETENSGSEIDAGIYQHDVTATTYKHLATLAKSCIISGYSTIVDATFLEYKQRKLFQDLANKLQCEFIILDCVADEKLMRQRIQQRSQRGTDASEADISVFEQQLKKRQALSDNEKDISLRIVTTEKLDIDEIYKRLLT